MPCGQPGIKLASSPSVTAACERLRACLCFSHIPERAVKALSQLALAALLPAADCLPPARRASSVMQPMAISCRRVKKSAFSANQMGVGNV